MKKKKLVTLEASKAFFAVWVTLVCLYATKLGDTFATTAAGKGLISSMGNLVCIWVSRLEECFHTKRWQRDCPLFVFSRISLDASRQVERHVTHGAGIGLTD